MCDENGSWIRIISKGCVFCCGTRETVPEDECSFLFRVIQGMAEVFYNRKYAILRNKCYESLGTHSCEIALQESSGDPDLQRKSRKPNNPLNETYP